MHLPKLPTLLCLFAVSLVAAPGALAQYAPEDGCVEPDPCPIEVSVDENGFSGESEWNITVGDWFVLRVENLDPDAMHHIHMPAFGVDVIVEPLMSAESHPFSAPHEGRFEIIQNPPDDMAWINATDEDVVAEEDAATDANTTTPPADGAGTGTRTDGDADAPGLLAALVAASLLAVARARRP